MSDFISTALAFTIGDWILFGASAINGCAILVWMVKMIRSKKSIVVPPKSYGQRIIALLENKECTRWSNDGLQLHAIHLWLNNGWLNIYHENTNIRDLLTWSEINRIYILYSEKHAALKILEVQAEKSRINRALEDHLTFLESMKSV